MQLVQSFQFRVEVTFVARLGHVTHKLTQCVVCVVCTDSCVNALTGSTAMWYFGGFSLLQKVKKAVYSASWEAKSQSYGASLAIWDQSHSVTCHPTTGRYSIYQPWRDGRLS